jgi:hypothetical protein
LGGIWVDIIELLSILLDLYYAVLAENDAISKYSNYCDFVRLLDTLSADLDAAIIAANEKTLEAHNCRIMYEHSDMAVLPFENYIDAYEDAAVSYLDWQYRYMELYHYMNRNPEKNNELSSNVLTTHKQCAHAYSKCMRYIRSFYPQANTIDVRPESLQKLMAACYNYRFRIDYNQFWETFESVVKINYIS